MVNADSTREIRVARRYESLNSESLLIERSGLHGIVVDKGCSCLFFKQAYLEGLCKYIKAIGPHILYLSTVEYSLRKCTLVNIPDRTSTDRCYLKRY